MSKYSDKQQSYSVLAIVLVFNLVVIAFAIFTFRHSPAILSVALLAYLFGLRHAVDADHIVAIDNVTRKLMNEGKSAISSGMYFSLGHASVVIIACLIFAFTTRPVQEMFPQIKEIGATISTLISGMFLLMLAYLNTRSLYVSYQKRRFLSDNPDTQSAVLDARFSTTHHGIMTQICGPLFKMVSKSRHMFFIGFLFGIGFDTATEVAIFGMSATQASQGEAIVNIMIMPLLFTAGMLLIDSLDGIMMINLYKWAQTDPLRKINYNIAISSLSIAVAAVIGIFEVVTVLSLEKIVFSSVSEIMEAVISELGYVLIGASVCVWLLFYTLYKIKVRRGIRALNSV